MCVYGRSILDTDMNSFTLKKNSPLAQVFVRSHFMSKYKKNKRCCWRSDWWSTEMILKRKCSKEDWRPSTVLALHTEVSHYPALYPPPRSAPSPLIFLRSAISAIC